MLARSPESTDYDIAVIGGGPAGATAAALLAERGLRVTVFEKDRHPRFHVGESLLPMNLPLFERLGVAEDVARIGMVKRAAEFHSAEHGTYVSYAFADAWDARWPHAYQVRRADLDKILLDNARAKGAFVRESCRVMRVDFEREAVEIEVAEGEQRTRCRARFVIDASGRDTMLAKKLGIKRRNPQHGSAALYGHFDGAERSAGEAEGDIAIYWFEHGWFWFIPLRDGTTSIGAVCWPYYLKSRTSDVSAFFLDTIQLCPALAKRLVHARLIDPPTATGNYSYACDRMAGDRYVMIGDAFAFVDPVFSSGVYLAMTSAFLAADAVEAALSNPAAGRTALASLDTTVRRGLRAFTWMIYRMATPSMRDLFMNPDDRLGIKKSVISLLAGDVYRGGPVARRLALFRAIYYMKNFANMGRTFRSWRRLAQIKRPAQIRATDGSG